MQTTLKMKGLGILQFSCLFFSGGGFCVCGNYTFTFFFFFPMKNVFYLLFLGCGYTGEVGRETSKVDRNLDLKVVNRNKNVCYYNAKENSK